MNGLKSIKSVGCWFCLLLTTVLLMACQSGGHTASPQSTYDENLVAALLSKGQAALEKDQLSTPDNDNALYYFRKVLLLAPEHPDARSGLEAIFDRYLQLGRNALDNDEFNKALAMVNQAEQVLLPTRSSKALRAQIQEDQKKAAANSKSKKPSKIKEASIDGIEYLLSIEGLNKKDKKIHERLKLIAEHTRTLKGSVRIEARDEAECAWIHEQLKAAVPKFKLRADIRKSQYPKVVVLRPD